ncbi:hypothetical protein [Streptosporangium sp. NPDC051022]|uniref:hypothetical protein n=1 Tax=Streptosporangium sp. NPDC051022 TaxID=3155752 RepID=UPI00343E5F33
MIRHILVASAVVGLAVTGSATVASADTPDGTWPPVEFVRNALGVRDTGPGLLPAVIGDKYPSDSVTTETSFESLGD